MDWRALMQQNQWFQLCALVATFSLGALGFDLATGRFGAHASNPTPGPGPTVAPGPTTVPRPTAAPAPVFAKLTPKTRGQWIVDASGAADADSRDLRAVAANVSDGDTVTIRAGSYEGGFEIAKNVHFIGQDNVSIRATNLNTVLVSAPQAAFDHLTIGFDGSGTKFAALNIVGHGHVELSGCTIGSKGVFDAYVWDNAVLNAHGSRFTTLGGGSALKFANNAHGKLEQCDISNNNWGIEAVNAAQVELTGCTLSKNGKADGKGNTLNVQGGQARITASFCTFSNNPASLYAGESGTLLINAGTLRDNGVSGETGNANDGLLCVQTGAHATLTSCVIEANKQCITVLDGGNLALTQVKISGSGIQTNNETLRSYSQGLYAVGRGTVVTISSSTIQNAFSNGITVFGGASLTMLDSTVTGSGFSGVYLGAPNNAASHAELTRTRLVANRSDGLLVTYGNSAETQGGEFSNNGANGVEAANPDTQVRIVNGACRNNKDTGLIDHHGGFLSANNCTLESNARGAQAGLANDVQSFASMELVNCTVRNNNVFGLGATRQSVIKFQGGFLGDQRQNISKENGGEVRQSR